MAFFSRRRNRAAEKQTEVEAAAPDPTPEEDAVTKDRGPWDISEVEELGRRVDLGALRIPASPGLKIRLEMEKRTRQVVAASISSAGSALQVQAFAAPRSGGLWDDLRPEIAASVEKQGGTADEVDGPFGREILARLPVTAQDGRVGHRPARFIGADGRRWFLRGVLSGKAAIDPDAAEELENLFADVVVVRGPEARPPRDVLPLTVPTKGDEQPDVEGEAEAGLDPLTRGPEITETR